MGRSQVVELKDYIDDKFEAVNDKINHLETVVNDKFDAAEKVANERQKTLDERLGHMNEFREQINKERSEYATKDSLDLRLKPIEVKHQRDLGRQAVQGTVFGIVFAIIILIAQVAAGFFFK